MITRLRGRPFRLFALVLLALLLILFWRTLAPGSDEALGGADMATLFVPWLTHVRESLAHGRLPWWHAGQFAGYPFLSNPQVALFYPPTWLALTLPVTMGISWYLLLHVWLAGTGMFLLVRSLPRPLLGAWLAGISFACSGFFTVRLWAGHMGLVAVHAWTPWLLWALLWSVRRRSVWAGILAGVPWGLAILAGHTTSLLYVGMIWLLFAIFLAFPGSERYYEKRGSDSASGRARRLLVGRQFLLAILTGLLLSGVQLLPLAQFSLASARSAAADFAFATGFSFPPAHLITLLVPEFFGEPTRAGYWSVPNFEELTAYVGALPLLALILVWRRPRRTTLFFAGVALLGLLLALGSYGFLYRIFYELLPPFRLARAPGRAAFLYTFAGAALLADLFVVWQPPAPAGRWLRWVAGITAVSSFTVLAALGGVFMTIHPTDTSGRLWHQVGGWSVAVAVMLLGCLLLWRYLTTTAAPQRRWMGVLLGLLVIADLWIFGSKFITLQPTTPDSLWRDVTSLIGQPEERVLPWGIDIFSQNGAWQAGLNSVFGYNALEIGANQAFTSSVPDPRATTYDILGVSYVVSGTPLEQYTDGERPLTLLGHVGKALIYERARSLPLARLLYEVEVIPDDTAAIARVHAPEFDPARVAILPAAADCPLTATETPGTATIVDRRDGYWLLQTNSSTPALLVLGETDFPGWQVTIDGERANGQTAYTAVRAVCVPAGEHEVVWRFVPTIYAVGGVFTFAALLLCWWAWRRLRYL